MRKIRHADGAVHFSALKRFALSPAHYKVCCETEREATRAMRVGTVAHYAVLGERPGARLVCYDGDARRGKAWEAFAAEHEGAEIVTKPEWDDGQIVAAAILADPVASELLSKGRREVPLRWDEAGIECATSGIDFIGDGYLLDLKITSCAEPNRWQRMAFGMLYHAQLAFYEMGALKHGIDTSKGLILLGVEPEPPYAVTPLRLTDALVEHGRKQCIKWLERLRLCEDSDYWPTYTQGIVDFDVPEWLADKAPAADPSWMTEEAVAP